MAKPRIMVFLPSHNCEKYIEQVLSEVEPKAWQRLTELIVVDDHSDDATSKYAKRFKSRMKKHKNKLIVIRNKKNLGYGGVQKLMYRRLLEKGYDYAIMMHGDYEHDPKQLSLFFAEADKGHPFVMGTRMEGNAISGGMPMHKWLGNRALTHFENFVLQSNFSEFHCGYRAWSAKVLKKIPFENLSNNFHFDSEILFQYSCLRLPVKEIKVRTMYNDKGSGFHVLDYGTNIMKSLGEFWLARRKLKKSEKFSF